MEQNGVLIINKPKGITSHTVISKLRRAYNMKKIGHTGTLDPMVDGVMVVCFGRATKLSQYLLDNDKIYRVSLILGLHTDTEDMTGEITYSQEITEELYQNIEKQLPHVLETFLGEYQQTPPMYSAVKIAGKKLYQYARAGEIIERTARQIKIHELDYDINNLSYDHENIQAHFSFDVHGSKGLFVRTLCKDIGKKLQIPATMNTLTRTASGQFTLDKAIPLEQILEEKPPLISLAELELPLPSVLVEDEVATKLRVGYKLPHYFIKEKLQTKFVVREKSTNQIIGVYEQSEKYPDKYQSVCVL